MKKLIIALVASTMMLGACSTSGQRGQNENFGTITGAVLGGLLGSQLGKGEGQLWATGAGAVLGAILGGEYGKTLDGTDQVMMERTSQASLEHTRTGTISKWSNPDSGNSGTVTPTRTYQRGDGTHCREFTQDVVIDGRVREATGTACRQADGSWRIVN
ncbi:RT0821/Lpp0805 family surface protein [Pseudomonadota bacterium]